MFYHFGFKFYNVAKKRKMFSNNENLKIPTEAKVTIFLGCLRMRKQLYPNDEVFKLCFYKYHFKDL